MRLYKLLEDKLYWYKKYLSCNEAYLIAIRHAPEIAIDEIDLFYGNRESLLKILEATDERIQEEMAQSSEKNLSFNSEQKTKIQYYIREKDSIIERIISLDKEIITELDRVHAEGLGKLASLTKGKKVLSNYKSGSSSNKKLDKRV